MDTISHILSSIDGIASFPILAMLLFLSVFVVIIIRVLKLDKQFIGSMSNIPFDGQGSESVNREVENE